MHGRRHRCPRPQGGSHKTQHEFIGPDKMLFDLLGALKCLKLLECEGLGLLVHSWFPQRKQPLDVEVILFKDYIVVFPVVKNFLNEKIVIWKQISFL